MPPKAPACGKCEPWRKAASVSGLHAHPLRPRQQLQQDTRQPGPAGRLLAWRLARRLAGLGAELLAGLREGLQTASHLCGQGDRGGVRVVGGMRCHHHRHTFGHPHPQVDNAVWVVDLQVCPAGLVGRRERRVASGQALTGGCFRPGTDCSHKGGNPCIWQAAPEPHCCRRRWALVGASSPLNAACRPGRLPVCSHLCAMMRRSSIGR